jgi:hypothetical protein
MSLFLYGADCLFGHSAVRDPNFFAFPMAPDLLAYSEWFGTRLDAYFVRLGD